jgi:hypothetical protein
LERLLVVSLPNPFYFNNIAASAAVLTACFASTTNA